MRQVLSASFENLQQIRANLLQWGASFDYFMLLDSNSDAEYGRLPEAYLNYQFLAAAGIKRCLRLNYPIFQPMKRFVEEQPDWYFVQISFDAKLETHGVPSQHVDLIGFPKAFVFSPLWLVLVKDNTLELHYSSSLDCGEAKLVLQKLLKPATSNGADKKEASKIKFSGVSFEVYQRAFESVQKHLLRGDIYEMNYCINFTASQVDIDPVGSYLRLADYSPAPFAVFYRHGSSYLLSASPERFLKKSHKCIISQPIKGTAPRGKDSVEDEALKAYLQQNGKDRSENIMITDLVRNDLSQFAEEGTVKVTDLCGVYTFRHVHQMISTIECILQQQMHAIDAIRLAFPMGSMTGAPKRNALKFIGTYETFNRGIFSGSVGYITPEGDFDLNVIIRSILYNAATRFLSIPAGSAITVYANALQEYKECCLKAQALMDVLS